MTIDNAKLIEQSKAVELKFLRTEVETGLTFADTALQFPNNQDKVRRNTENARKAYDTVVHFLKKREIPDERLNQTLQLLVVLQLKLRQLGESV